MQLSYSHCLAATSMEKAVMLCHTQSLPWLLCLFLDYQERIWNVITTYTPRQELQYSTNVPEVPDQVSAFGSTFSAKTDGFKRPLIFWKAAIPVDGTRPTMVAVQRAFTPLNA
mmetsp:Transcript_24281/g.67310  ORF Transcript_24281/g.67310 Transcript_24281/m.67310 type:complete len:113 (-) Transcript_24281:327-665(-)